MLRPNFSADKRSGLCLGLDKGLRGSLTLMLLQSRPCQRSGPCLGLDEGLRGSLTLMLL
jgi:hypothetical protein